MSELTSKDIHLGSGSLYVMDWPSTGVLPADSVIEVEANRIGHIKSGATLSYSATYYTIKDDLSLVKKIALTEEDATLKSGIITWNPGTIATLVSTAEATDIVDTTSQPPEVIGRQVTVGGIQNSNLKEYLVRFVHADGKKRLTMKANCLATLELVFQQDQETSVNAEFSALPVDGGRLFTYSELD